MTESAIAEEPDFDPQEIQDDIQPDGADTPYDIEEPQDDEEYKVPIIDNLESDDNPDDKSADPAKEKRPAKSSDKTDDKTDKPAAKQDKEAASSLSEELVAKAKKLGISDADLALYKTPQQLERLCSLLEPKAAKEPAKEDKQEPRTSADPAGEFKVELDPDLYDPDLCKAIQSTADQINSLKNALGSVMQMVHRQSEHSFERTFEGLVSELGDGFSQTLGKGGLEEIGTDSEFFKNRCKVIEEMNAIATGYDHTGKPVPPVKQLFQRAVNSIFGDTIKKNTRKEIAGQLQKRAEQIISRPSNRTGKDTLSPSQRATNAVRDKLREFGAYDQNEMEEDF